MGRPSFQKALFSEGKKEPALFLCTARDNETADIDIHFFRSEGADRLRQTKYDLASNGLPLGH